MNLKYPIDVYGLRRKVFNHTVAKTYLTLKEIAQLPTYDEGYQRQRDKEHEEKLIEYLTNSSNRYLPDIVIAIRHQDINFGNRELLRNRDFYIAKIKAYKILRISFGTVNALNSIKVIDGNHRISAIKKILYDNPQSELTDFEIGVTFIFTNDTRSDFENEMALFYYLNAKSKPLLPNDYLNEATTELSDEKAKEIDWWLFVFKHSNKRLTEIFESKLDQEILSKSIAPSCDYLAKHIELNDMERMPIFFDALEDIVRSSLLDKLFNWFVENDQFDTIIKILFYIFTKHENEDSKKTVKEVDYFCDWLINHAKLIEFPVFENLYQTYKETYIPQDYKIFVAMEFAGNDSVFSAIEGTIKKVSRDLSLPLECIRIDKVEKGNTYQIMDEILKQIQHNRLLIADITNKNANVYLEVGYAMGLARSRGIENQIMFFVKDEGNNTDVGFDLQSYHQNRYKDTEDLRKKLESQLIAYYSRPIE